MQQKNATPHKNHQGREMADRGESVAGVGNQETRLSNRTIAHRHTLDESRSAHSFLIEVSPLHTHPLSLSL